MFIGLIQSDGWSVLLSQKLQEGNLVLLSVYYKCVDLPNKIELFTP